MPNYQVTLKDFDRIQKKLKNQEQRLKDLRATKAETAENCGDQWHDNPTFSDLENKERVLMKDIRELKDKISMLEVIDINNIAKSNCVAIGKTVKIEFEDGYIEQVEIVGHMNGDPPTQIAYDSPLGSAIMGAKLDETRSFFVENNRIQVRIKEVT